VAAVPLSGVPDPVRHLTARAFLFLLWIVLANDWLSHHLGFGWDDARLALAVGTLGTGVGLLEFATGEKLKEKWLGKVVSRVLSTPLLVLAYGILIFSLSSISSVTIVNDTGNMSLNAKLMAADIGNTSVRTETNEDNPKEAVYFHRIWITPLGRSYRLELTGYQPEMLTVYPVVGSTVDPHRDLRPVPVVIIRPPMNIIPLMQSKVPFEVWKIAPKGRISVATGSVEQGSIVLGEAQSIPSSMLEDWRLEASASTDQPMMAAQLLRIWKKQQAVATQQELAASDVLEAIIFNTAKQPVAKSTFRLSQERIQDVELEPSQ